MFHGVPLFAAPVITLLDIRAVASVLVGFGLTGAALWGARRAPRAAFCWLFYAGGLATVLGFIPINIEVADRYQYESSLALAFGGGWLLLEAARRYSWRSASRSAALLLVVLGGLSFARMEVWSDEGLLWFDVIEQDERGELLGARVNLASALIRRQMRDEARVELERVARAEGALVGPGLGPGYHARHKLALLALEDGDPAKAKAWLSGAVAAPPDPEILDVLISLALHDGDVAQAAALADRILPGALLPREIAARAALDLARGRTAEAQQRLRTGAAAWPVLCLPRFLDRFPAPLALQMRAEVSPICGGPPG